MTKYRLMQERFEPTTTQFRLVDAANRTDPSDGGGLTQPLLISIFVTISQFIPSFSSFSVRQHFVMFMVLLSAIYSSDFRN